MKLQGEESNKRKEDSSESSNQTHILQDLNEIDDKGENQINEPRQGKLENLLFKIIGGNQFPSNGMTIKFLAPTVVDGEIEIEIDDGDALTKMRY